MAAPITIHFVCRGNTYRSRLAEAYARSLRVPGFHFSSSGIDTGANRRASVSPVTARILREQGLDGFMAAQKCQTTEAILARQDLVIFLSKDVFDQTVQQLSFDHRKAMLWHVDDVWQQLQRAGQTLDDAAAIERLARQTAQRILRRVQELAAETLRRPWVAVYDRENQPLGYCLPIARSGQPGLWHRGVHAVIVTHDGKYLIQKRSATITYSPNLLDVSLGGLIDPGETPLRALYREIREEIGINIQSAQVRPLSIHRIASFHRHLRRPSRTFVYTYYVKLSAPVPPLRLQTSEVSDVRFVSRQRVVRLVRRRRLPGFGALNYTYSYYAAILKHVKLLETNR